MHSAQQRINLQCRTQVWDGPIRFAAFEIKTTESEPCSRVLRLNAQRCLISLERGIAVEQLYLHVADTAPDGSLVASRAGFQCLLEKNQCRSPLFLAVADQAPLLEMLN